jgi:ABC-type transport system substrate-binding protein
VFERNEDWKSGALPKARRIIWRTVPSAGNRRALMERGDADISFDLPNKDFAELRQLGKVAVATTPIGNGIGYIGMNCKNPPFNNVKVRQAVAYAIPTRSHGRGDVRPRRADVRHKPDAPIQVACRSRTYSTDSPRPAAAGRGRSCASRPR